MGSFECEWVSIGLKEATGEGTRKRGRVVQQTCSYYVLGMIDYVSVIYFESFYFDVGTSCHDS